MKAPRGAPSAPGPRDVEEIVEAIATLLRSALDGRTPSGDPCQGEPWLSVAAGALHASVSEDTLREWIASGALRVGRVGRIIRVRRSEIDRLLLAEDSQMAAIEEPEPEEPDVADGETSERARKILTSLKGGSRG